MTTRSTAPRSKRLRPRPIVLVALADLLLVELIGHLLRAHGYRLLAPVLKADYLIPACQRGGPAVVVIDPTWCGRNPWQEIAKLRRLPGCPRVVLLGHGEALPIGRLLSSGCHAVLSARSGANELCEAIDRAAGGEYYISPHLEVSTPVTRVTSSRPLLASQRRLLLHLQRGATQAQCAEILRVSLSSIEVRVKRLRGRLHLPTGRIDWRLVALIERE